jgi:hypothetical protein
MPALGTVNQTALTPPTVWNYLPIVRSFIRMFPGEAALAGNVLGNTGLLYAQDIIYDGINAA